MLRPEAERQAGSARGVRGLGVRHAETLKTPRHSAAPINTDMRRRSWYVLENEPVKFSTDGPKLVYY
jgi:hypothetical protein